MEFIGTLQQCRVWPPAPYGSGLVRPPSHQYSTQSGSVQLHWPPPRPPLRQTALWSHDFTQVADKAYSSDCGVPALVFSLGASEATSIDTRALAVANNLPKAFAGRRCCCTCLHTDQECCCTRYCAYGPRAACHIVLNSPSLGELGGIQCTSSLSAGSAGFACLRGLREVCGVWVCGCGVCGLHAGSARSTGFGSVAAGSAGFVGFARFAGLLEEGEYRGSS